MEEKQKRIFIVEDNELIRDGVQEYFEVSGYEVAAFGDLKSAREALGYLFPDLIILDVMLPDGNGFLFARDIRRDMDLPILFLTARENESDRIMGFEVGGDDYVVKPFSNKELLLRVKALLRRSNGIPEKEREEQKNLVRSIWHLESSSIVIDKKARKLYVDESEAHLTASEWNILLFLSDHQNQAISREAILGTCLGYLHGGSERTIDTHIANLRQQLGSSEWIETIRGFGYRFTGDAVSQEPGK